MSGAVVIRSNGLPDGYEPPSTSLDPPTVRCAHRQAEPVELSTGEVVACICIECLADLPADYVTRQLAAARQQATCSHESAESVMAWGSTVPVATHCTECAEAR